MFLFLLAELFFSFLILDLRLHILFLLILDYFVDRGTVFDFDDFLNYLPLGLFLFRLDLYDDWIEIYCILQGKDPVVEAPLNVINQILGSNIVHDFLTNLLTGCFQQAVDLLLVFHFALFESIQHEKLKIFGYVNRLLIGNYYQFLNMLHILHHNNL